MRIYGSSPLFNYVELVFRSKRVFIIAIVLGTALTSILVAMRPRQYAAELIVALTPSPNPLAGSTQKLEDNDKANVARRVRRLALLLKNDPEFLRDAARDAGFENKYGAKTDEMVRRVKTSISGPEMLTEDIVRVGIVWPDPEEAETLLQRVYDKYLFVTVESETASATWNTQSLGERLAEARREADEVTRRRVEVMRRNYYVSAGSVASAQSELKGSERTMMLLRGDMGEYEMHLAEVERQLRNTPEKIERSNSTTSVAADPTFELKQQRDDLRRRLGTLRTRYSDFHPQVVDLNKQLAQVDAEIAEAARQPKRNRETQQSREIVINPEYSALKVRQAQLQQILRGMGRRMSLLQRDRADQAARMNRMPAAEVQSKEIEREYAIKESMRNSLEAKYAAAKVEERQSKALAAKSVIQPWEPKAELIESGGKRMLFYAAGPILGLFIAFCFCLLAEALDHTLRTPVDVEKYLGKPVLAVIPRMAPARAAQKQLAGAARRSITQ